MLGYKTGVELTPELVRLRRPGDETATSEIEMADCAPCHDDQPVFDDDKSLMEEGVSMVEDLSLKR